MRTRKTQIKLSAPTLLLSLFAAAMAGCGANEPVLNSSKETPAQTDVRQQRSSYERELEAMQTAKFMFIYVLRRSDGKSIDSDDIRVIRQLTKDTNRRVKTDDNSAVLIGSNFELPKESLSLLHARFSVEEHPSLPPAAGNTNTNFSK